MRIPIATYRLQLNYMFGFKAAMEIIPYLAELGISDIYASPIFKAKSKSLHGYDLVDPNELNPELGTLSDFEELIAEVHAHGMGWLQDIVPNHMAFDSENTMLMDVFENGPSSEYYDFFDINWGEDEQAQPVVLAPFLGKFYGDALEEGEISLTFGPGGLSAKYYDFVFPLKIESYAQVFTHRLSQLRAELGESHSDFIRYLGALYVLQGLSSLEGKLERHDRVNVIKQTFWDLYENNPAIAAFVDMNLKKFSGIPGRPDSYNLLDDLLSEQVFRFSFWKVAYEEINYRRFFSINNLISIRMDNPRVFDHQHTLILSLVAEQKIDGLRIDHIDGLYDPTEYLRRLRSRINDTYIVVEKILDMDEELPHVWPIQGTTGYDFADYVNELFCRMDRQAALTRVYTGFTRQRTSYNDLVYDKKRLIIETHMGGDVANLARLLKKIAGQDRHGRDITLYGLRRALVEILAQFPVYRTYVNSQLISPQDQEYIVEAARRASNHNPRLLNEIDYLKKFFLLDFGANISDEEKRERVRFVMRFQQFTGPLMAKGFEDTLLYVYNRLLSLNEVGSSPQRFGIPLYEFHGFNKMRACCWPLALNATSTHDTKRGEDVRARIDVLSEMPQEWEAALKSWNRLNRRAKLTKRGLTIPDRNDEYFLYQTLLGTFPSQKDDYQNYVERIKQYSVKVVREAKVHTAWLRPDVKYENAFLSFAEKTILPRDNNRFLEEFLPLEKQISYFGIFNSLSQLLMKATAPGIPDFYQGTELWDLSLVDPDNRRPVDFRKRERLLAEIKEKSARDLHGLIGELLKSKEDGRIKLFITHRLLLARKENPLVFREGDYLPLAVDGKFSENIITFARVRNERWAIAIAPRFLAGLIQYGQDPIGEDVWGDTNIQLPDNSPRQWRNVFDEEPLILDKILPIGKALERFPVTLLISEEQE